MGRMQAQQDGGGLHRVGRRTVVLACQFFEGEFLVAADFPQKGGVEIDHLRLGPADQR
jgi:hypothetical protein